MLTFARLSHNCYLEVVMWGMLVYICTYSSRQDTFFLGTTFRQELCNLYYTRIQLAKLIMQNKAITSTAGPTPVTVILYCS
jgi:hypothetical protein